MDRACTGPDLGIVYLIINETFGALASVKDWPVAIPEWVANLRLPHKEKHVQVPDLQKRAELMISE